LSDGKQAFLLSLYFANTFRRELILRKAQRFLVVSVEEQRSPHSERVPNMSVVELHEMSTPLVLSEVGRVKSERRLNDLKRRTSRLLAAAHGGNVVLATDNAVYVADDELKLRTELTSDFEPAGLSLDEGGTIYLSVRYKGAPELWVVTPSGERVARVPLPLGFTPIAPPIVGYDHSVYLVSAGRILAVGSSGQVLWDRALASVVGAVVGSDNGLLVSAGDSIVSLAATGEQQAVFRAEGDVLTSPPSMTAAGDVLVAGEKNVYSLRPLEKP
jgi:hypothetical protein